jgi:putative transposase
MSWTEAMKSHTEADFIYFKIIGWEWMYLSTVLDDFSRHIIA